jgi:hypothetical protein
MSRSLALMTLALLPLTGSCHHPLGPDVAPFGTLVNSTTVMWQGIPVMLTVRTSRAETGRGEPVTIDVAVTNPNDHQVTLGFPMGCNLVYGVASPDGTVIQPSGGGYICVAVGSMIRLEPGETKWRRAAWPEPLYYPATGGTPPAPGTYRVFAALGQNLEARSGAVRVRVR